MVYSLPLCSSGSSVWRRKTYFFFLLVYMNYVTTVKIMHNKPNVQACQLLYKKILQELLSCSSFVTFSPDYDFSLQAL